MDPKNIIIPWKKELHKIAKKNTYPTWNREDMQRWTNCIWETINFLKNWKNKKLFIKKSFLKRDIKQFENDYKLLKEKLKNIIPNQAFIRTWDNSVFAFCAPIDIKVDILLEENEEYIIELLKKDKKLLKQLKFFIRQFEELKNEWKIIDLFWKENLVISDENKLYYVDSFLVFHESEIIKNWSLENFEKIKKLVEKSYL